MTKVVVLSEDLSLLDKLFWQTFSKKTTATLHEIVLINREYKKNSINFTPFLLEIGDCSTVLKLRSRGEQLDLNSIFHVVTKVSFSEAMSFNSWIEERFNLEEVTFISVGCPFLITNNVLKNLKNVAVNLHNSDTRELRGHFGTFWEFYFQTSHNLVLHEINSNTDDGKILEHRRINQEKPYSILHALVKKKILGAIILANYINERPRREICSSPPAEIQTLPFPKLGHILKLRGRKILVSLNNFLWRSHV